MTDPSKPPSAPAARDARSAVSGGALKTSSGTGGRDQLLVCGPTEGNDGFHVLRKRGEQVELGKIQSLQEGQPIHGEVVKLTPQAEGTPVYDVEVLVSGAQTRQLNKSGQGKSGQGKSGQGQSGQGPSGQDNVAQLSAGVGAKAGRHKGPARVTSKTYRQGWDAIFDREEDALAAPPDPTDLSKLN